MRKIALALAVAALCVLAACSDSSEATPTGTITVFAASSLKDAFEKIGAQFEQANPGMNVTFDFAGSSDLVSQIKNGAPADVFASADTDTMAELGSKALEGVSFAANPLEIAVPIGNPKQITSLADLARWDVNEVVCAPQVPCGAATEKVLALAGVALTPVSEEQSVADVLAKVESGEADAGLVYVSDVKTSGHRVQGITFDESGQVVNRYQITGLKDAKNNAVANAFINFVLSPESQKILTEAGFSKP